MSDAAVLAELDQLSHTDHPHQLTETHSVADEEQRDSLVHIVRAMAQTYIDEIQ